MAESKPRSGLSSYEENRARNIERNNAKLRALGLITVAEEKVSNHSAWKREPAVGETSKTAKNGVKKRETPAAPPSRSSKRIKGEQPDGTLVTEVVSHRDTSITEEDRERRVRECREARQRAALELQQSGAKHNNPTATYAHCLMRVQTMSDAALLNRIKAIERAAGKHCVIKMAIFKSCLQDEGYWELAQRASDSLERLKALQPPPADE